MTRNPSHAMQATASHDERARQDFVGALKLYSGRRLRPGNRAFFAAEAAPDYAREHGHPPKTEAEITEAMRSNLHYQTWSALHRSGQEQMWDAVTDTLLRDTPRLEMNYRQLTENPARRGSLELDPDFEIPAALRETQIHLQPGTYALDRNPQDFLAGALYEAGGALYSRAQGIGTTESKAEVMMRFLGARFPGFKPARMLDIACSAGSSSVPYALALPEAEVHAIDVAPGLLRYAHARAEALGAAVHFHQRDAASTGFPDAHFDLVVSHNAMHEMPTATVAAMFRESYRLLKPGGVCLHQDVPLRYENLGAYDRFEWGWDKTYNGEPYWVDYATNDCRSMLLDAGFSEDEIFVGFADQVDKSIKWYVACGRKS